MPSRTSYTPTMRTPFVKRAVSPLDAEPITVPPEDILYPASDDGLSAEGRRNKRRRIEAEGQRYLEGKPLFILSAALRGPLDTGWVNPFKRRKRAGILRRSDQQIVDLTQPEPPVRPPDDTTRHAAPTQNPALFPSTGIRGSVVSDIGPQKSSFDVSERRAKSIDLGAKSRVKEGRGPGKKPLPARSTLRGCSRRPSKSPSPSCTIRQLTPTATSKAIRTSPHQHYNRSPERPAYGGDLVPPGFTPVNKSTRPVDPDRALAADQEGRFDPRPVAQKQLPRDLSDITQSAPLRYTETSLAEIDEDTRRSFYCAKALCQKAIRKAQDEEGQQEARRLSQKGALRASQSAIGPGPLQAGHSKPSAGDVESLPERAADLTKKHDVIVAEIKKKISKETPRQVPPMGNLSSFKFRVARKIRPTLEDTADLSPFARELRAAKAKAEARTIKHLSFTSSGGIRSFGSQSTSRASSIETARPRRNHQDPISSQEDSRKKSKLIAIDHSPHRNAEKHIRLSDVSLQDPKAHQHDHLPQPSVEDDIPDAHQIDQSSHTGGEDRNETSDILPQGPEAQPAQAPSGPSGPSTHLLETDKQSLNFPSTEEGEGDSYMNLSTQAAFLKAQQCFDDTIQSPVEDSPSHQNLFNGSQLSPTAYKTPKVHLPAIPPSLRPDLSNGQPITPSNQPLNTQAIIEAISPFAVTTIKKKGSSPIKSVLLNKGASFATSPLPSPTHLFGTIRRSLSMSTSSGSPSPSPTRTSPKRTSAIRSAPILSNPSTGISKPPSTALSTAFSIAPNGTLTEVYQHDGQQQYDPITGFDSGFDLDQALEEAGSFLETLDVEAETRKGGTALASGSGG